MTAPEIVRVTTLVAVDPQVAFRVFTEEIDLWWRRSPQHRPGGQYSAKLDKAGTLAFEGGPTGQLVESFPDGSRFEIGRVLQWEPGAKLRFEWNDQDPGEAQPTEVEVRFDLAGDGTRVTVEHRGWERVLLESSTRHGLRGAAFEAMIGYRWSDLLLDLRRHCDTMSP